ncbi:hypothetical protein ADUPG1_010007 [Aduncisulcus paluster]|uniref:Metallo-beta-lactamase domain-containing protein n=1 Tax=Aduncisulcus paluster TaxID=2918883 RepID=A0ABQ5KZM1_9EUKA|nr:hypothetical protein ADUPG1_010007 [Aduncisulcus paluster]
MANCYVLADKKTKQCVVIDCGGQHIQASIEIIKSNGFKPIYILATHAHFDHIEGTGIMKDAFPSVPFLVHKKGAKVCSRASKQLSDVCMWMIRRDIIDADDYFDNGSVFKLGPNLSISVLHTPGHSPGSTVFMVYIKKVLTYAISGDTAVMKGAAPMFWEGSLFWTKMSFVNFLEHIEKEANRVDLETFKLLPGHFAPLPFMKIRNGRYAKKAMKWAAKQRERECLALDI